MSRRTRMLILAGGMLLAGCLNSQIVRVANLEKATTVRLDDQGDPQKEGDETQSVIDEPFRIEMVTAFIKSRTDSWRATGDLPRPARYTLSFCKNGVATDVFWLGRGRLETKDKSGMIHSLSLSDDEVEELVNVFPGKQNLRSEN